jgi:stalled ribosome rescue protein Dom34
MKTGIWIDTKKAVVVHINNSEAKAKVIESGVELIREEGEGKQFGRFGEQYLDHEKAKESKLKKHVNDYLNEVVDELKSTKDLVIFGPAHMKKELHKKLSDDKSKTDLYVAVETADSMTDNQIIAWAKEYFKK